MQHERLGRGVMCSEVEGVVREMLPRREGEGHGEKDGDGGVGGMEVEVGGGESDDSDSDGGVEVVGEDSAASGHAGEGKTATTANPQQAGLDRAFFRERVRRAGRRVIAFGPPILTDDHEFEQSLQGIGKDRVFECVQDGKSVEPSFAKGEWALRVRS